MAIVGYLISIAVLLQTFEMFWIKPWPLSTRKTEIAPLLSVFLSRSNALLIVRLFAALSAIIWPHPLIVTVLIVTTWLVGLQWRGTFNGGSDIMTMHILIAWCVSLVFPHFEKICLFYVAAQIILSFFIAGMSKVREQEWRNGHALKKFLSREGWDITLRQSYFIGWIVIIFEVLFPLSLWLPMPFIVMAILFQIANVYVFGLNRFFFVWLAGYPALLAAAR